jgi:hypothetical protein
MRKVIQILAFTLLASACSTGVELKGVNYGSLFHDGNSKVWMIDRVLIGKKDFSPPERRNKDIIIFFENGKCQFQPINTLGDIQGRKGEYSVFSNEKIITLYFDKAEKWEFELASIKDNEIVLKPTNNSDLKYKLILIPLPEL